MDIAALILSLMSFCFALYCFIDIMAQKRSTHKIQIVDPASMMSGEPSFQPKKPIVADDFMEFDDPAGMVLDEMKAAKKRQVS